MPPEKTPLSETWVVGNHGWLPSGVVQLDSRDVPPPRLPPWPNDSSAFCIVTSLDSHLAFAHLPTGSLNVTATLHIFHRRIGCLALATFVSFVFAACLPTVDGAPNENVSPKAIAFFEKEVRPILIEHCYQCHSGDERDGGLEIDTKMGLIKGGDSGAALVPGQPETSRLIDAIEYNNHDLQMPPEGRMSDHEIQTLRRWIQIGAPDPRGDADGDRPPIDPVNNRSKGNRSEGSRPKGNRSAITSMTVNEGRDFWAFQSVADPKPPAVTNDAWVRSPIDAFILKKLESVGLQPARPADRRTMIRRVTFDLIGLPPTPSEVEAFVADTSPDAFVILVERLLASPQYGVRWGRHWLDVARYADSNGLDENLAFGNAWRYRDYVIDAMNHDKPYDRFLVEQIAGDLLPAANRETKTATGYLVLGAKVLAEPDREKLEMDTIDEQIDSIGKAFLGMTFGCVRCHDHKFDPVKQRDYYALAAIFKSTKTFGDSNQGAIKHWYEHDFATDEERERIAKIDAEIAAKKKAAANFKNKTIAAIRAEAVENAAEYLVAATKFDPDASLNTVASIAKPLGLHPRILHSCRRYLDVHRDDIVLGAWHSLAVDPNANAVGEHYRQLFADAHDALAVARKANPAAKKTDDEKINAVLAILNDRSGMLAVPAKPQFAFDSEQLRRYGQLMEAARLIESHAADLPSAMGVIDGAIADEIPIHIRGSHRNLGESVPREFPEVMRTSDVRPIFPTNQSGRLQLARWMASTQHPLTARVYVNRLWSWHFGRGIVGSTDNFGVLGDRPSHGDLLDYLARRLMQDGWSTKDMHRLILNSNVYQMKSTADDRAALSMDPQNRWLSRFPMQRLGAEQIRDSILAISGRLDRSLGGKSVPLRNRQFVFNHTSVDHTKYDSLRRSVFLPVIRNNLYSFFSQFDFPDPTMPTGTRNVTTVAPQALLMMNAPWIAQAADDFATKLIDARSTNDDRIDLAYRMALGRHATSADKQRSGAFIDDLTSHAFTGSDTIDAKAELQAWSLFCQSLFASNEFIFIR